MAIERIAGRRLGSGEIVEFDYDPRDTNSFGVPAADREANLVEHHRRIAPEVRAVIAPAREDIGGVLLSGERPVVFSDRSGPGAQSTLFHELWHYAERRVLSDTDCQIVYRECRRHGDTWGSSYLDSDTERAARAFQHYASARTSGLQISPARRGTAQHIFERLYEGTEHAALTKSRRHQSFRRLKERVADTTLGGFMALCCAPFAGLAFIMIRGLVCKQ